MTSQDILKQLQAHVDFLAETGRDSMEVTFDELNSAVGEIERLRTALAERDADKHDR